MTFKFFKKAKKNHIGLDINSEGITALAVTVKNKKLMVKNYAYEPFQDQVIQNGLIVDIEAFIETVNKIFEKQKIITKLVNIALPGNITLIKTINLPNLPIEELAVIVPQEAIKHIPFPIEEVNIDFEILENPNKQQNTNKRIDVVLVAIPKTIIQNYMDAFKKMGLTVASVDVAPFTMIRTLANAGLIYESENIDISVLVGDENTDINIIYKGNPIFTNNFPVGKKNIIDSLAHSLEIDNMAAEKLLPEIALMVPGTNIDEIDPQKNKAAAAVRSIYNNICNEILKTIEFYNSQNIEAVQIASIFVAGTGICTQNIDKYIANRLKINTVLCESLKNIDNTIDYGDNPIYPINIPALATSVGLALKGL